jgi:RNA polymerase sigma-70 factor, ECF subfamily
MPDVSPDPGAIFRDRDGKVLCALALNILGGRIQTICGDQPRQAGHVGPVADAWTIRRGAMRTRRPAD